MEGLEALRRLLGFKAGEKEDVLAHCLASCRQLALDYCHLDQLPQALEPVVVEMAAEQVRLSGYGQPQAPVGPVTAVQEGSQSIHYGEAAGGLTADFAARLARYRRLSW